MKKPRTVEAVLLHTTLPSTHWGIFSYFIAYDMSTTEWFKTFMVELCMLTSYKQKYRLG